MLDDAGLSWLALASLLLLLPLSWLLWRAPGASRSFRLLSAGLSALVLAGLVFQTYARGEWLDFMSGFGKAPKEVLAGDYVSSDSCMACHPGRYSSWHDTYHRTMTQQPSAETVAGPFDRTLTLDGEEYRLFREDDRFLVDMPTPAWRKTSKSGPRITLPVGLLTGSHHYQVYWLESGKGRTLAQLPFVYLIPEGIWIARSDIFLLPPGHPKGDEFGRWNGECVRCHTTNGRPNPAASATASTKTEASEFGIACESCHGPGGRHIEAMRNPLKRYAALLGWQDDSADLGVVDPAELPHERGMEVCGQCHSINGPTPAEVETWPSEGFSYRPGDDLRASRIVYDAEAMEHHPHFFWKDGVVRVRGREFTALESSACFQQGELTCLNCHAVHQREDDPRPRSEWRNALLRGDQSTDASCLGCHGELTAAPARLAHTRHSAGSSGDACINCHMPKNSFGIGRAIRNHAITTPSVLEDLDLGRPNACNACHVDKPLAWTAAAMQDWYGTPIPERQLSVAAEVPATLHWLHAGDASQRALAVEQLAEAAANGLVDGDWARAHLLHASADDYRVVQLMGLRALDRLQQLAAQPRLDPQWFMLPDGGMQAMIEATLARAPADSPMVRQLRAIQDKKEIMLAE